jgi:hypothetical protein
MSDLPVAHAFPCSTATGTVIGRCLPLRCCFFFGFTLFTSAGFTQALAVDAADSSESVVFRFLDSSSDILLSLASSRNLVHETASPYALDKIV